MFGGLLGGKKRESNAIRAGAFSSAGADRHSQVPRPSTAMAESLMEDLESAEMPSSAEIDRLLETMLEQQGQKAVVRQNIMKLTDDKKWLMLQG